MHRFSVGNFECMVLNVGFFEMPPDVMMAPATVEERAATA